MNTTPTLNPQIFAHLQRQGVITADRVTTKPTTRTCRTCGAPIIAALEDEPTMRFRIELTPHFLTPYGELTCLMTDTPTYTYTPTSIRWRHPTTITNKPANTTNVMAHHKCTNPTFEHGPPPQPPTKTTTPPPNNNTPCPY